MYQCISTAWTKWIFTYLRSKYYKKSEKSCFEKINTSPIASEVSSGWELTSSNPCAELSFEDEQLWFQQFTSPFRSTKSMPQPVKLVQRAINLILKLLICFSLKQYGFLPPPSQSSGISWVPSVSEWSQFLSVCLWLSPYNFGVQKGLQIIVVSTEQIFMFWSQNYHELEKVPWNDQWIANVSVPLQFDQFQIMSAVLHHDFFLHYIHCFQAPLVQLQGQKLAYS